MIAAVLLPGHEGAYVTSGSSTQGGRRVGSGPVAAFARRSHGPTRGTMTRNWEAPCVVVLATWVGQSISVAGHVPDQRSGNDGLTMRVAQPSDGESLERRVRSLESSSGTAHYGAKAAEAEDGPYVIPCSLSWMCVAGYK